jgi:hypothetical protein
MKIFYFIGVAYLIALLLACIGGIKNWKFIRLELKLVTVIACCSLCTELISIFVHDVFIHHRILTVVQLSLTVSCYLILLKKKSFKYFALTAIFTVIIVCADSMFSPIRDNKGVLTLCAEGVIYTILGVHALFILMTSEDINILKQPLFYFWAMQLFGGFASFLYWGIYNIAKQKYPDIYYKMDLGNVIVNLIIYSCIAYAMLLLPKLNKTTA